MYLTYLDDGGKGAIKVFGGVLLKDRDFQSLEISSAVIVCDLLPDERREKFTEFHASELFAGVGIFEGIGEAERHDALRKLIQLPRRLHIPYFYSAINTDALNRGPVRSALWMDTAFFMCACAIDKHLVDDYKKAWTAFYDTVNPHPSGVIALPPDFPLSIIIIDETDKAGKERIRNSFRLMRQPLARALYRTPKGSFGFSNRLCVHVDEVLFGNSADSIGLQMADACNWAMWQHLTGQDEGKFYAELNHGSVFCAKPEPEWTQYRHLFKAHDEP